MILFDYDVFNLHKFQYPAKEDTSCFHHGDYINGSCLGPRKRKNDACPLGKEKCIRFCYRAKYCIGCPLDPEACQMLCVFSKDSREILENQGIIEKSLLGKLQDMYFTVPEARKIIIHKKVQKISEIIGMNKDNHDTLLALGLIFPKDIPQSVFEKITQLKKKRREFEARSYRGGGNW